MNLVYLLRYKIGDSNSGTVGTRINSTGVANGLRWVDRIPIGVDRDIIGSPICYTSLWDEDNPRFSHGEGYSITIIWIDTNNYINL